MKTEDRFIPTEKLSKKARKEREKAKRGIWTIPPITKRIENKKKYNRKRGKEVPNNV